MGIELPTRNMRYSTTPSSKKLPPDDCDNDRCQCRRFEHQSSYFALLYMVVAITWLWFYPALKCRICRSNFDVFCHSSGDTITSGFGGHIAMSGYPSLLQSLADTFFELYTVVNPRFAVGISMLPVTVSEIYVFPVSAAISGYRLLLKLPRDTNFERTVVESGCRSSSKLLSLRSPWSILPGSQLKRNKVNFFLSKHREPFYPQSHQVFLCA